MPERLRKVSLDMTNMPPNLDEGEEEADEQPSKVDADELAEMLAQPGDADDAEQRSEHGDNDGCVW